MKISFKNMQGKLSHAEMKNVLGGCGTYDRTQYICGKCKFPNGADGMFDSMGNCVKCRPH